MSITKKLKQFELTNSQKFNEKTKIHNVKEINKLAVSKWPKEWKQVYYKGYPRFGAIPLSTPHLDEEISFTNTLKNRKSTRRFSGKPIDLKKLSTLLYYSSGLKKDKKGNILNRFYPSAGGRYTLEVYPIVFNVKKLDSGLYHYYLKNHVLELLPKKDNYKKNAIDYFGKQKWVKDSSLLLVISAVFYRNQVKYGDRGYRHVLVEVGSLIQNIYLVCSALNIGCCPTGGYVDNSYNNLLDLDGIEESVLGVVAIGDI